MSDKDYTASAAALRETEELDGTWGDDYPLVVEEPTLGELESLEENLGEDAGEEAVIREMVNRYLLEPEVDASEVAVSKLRPLFEGMQEAFRGADAFEDAEAEMPLDEGN